MSKLGYHVVLEYTAEAGGYAGVRTQTAFKSEADFNAWVAEGGTKEQKVIAQGVLSGEATALCAETPLSAHMAAAVEAATNPETGEVNREVAKMHAMNVALVFGGRSIRRI